jgi:hypothetical protein
MRINALGNTATDFASDDYIAIDSTTNGSRKMAKATLLQKSAENSYAFFPFVQMGINKLVKELYFSENGCTASIVGVAVYKNYLNLANKYVNGIQISFGGNTINLFTASDTAESNVAFFVKSNDDSVFALIDLTSLTDGDTWSTSYNIRKDLVNNLDFWPGIKNHFVKDRLDGIEQDISTNDGRLDRLEGCFEDVVDPKNVYDNSNPNILKIYINGNAFVNDTHTRIVYFKCKKNQKYVISVDSSLYHRFSASVTTEIPAAGVTGTMLFQYTTAHTTQDGRTYWSCETLNDSEYLSVYYYNSNYDTATEEDIRATIMVAEGEVLTPYAPYKKDTLLKEAALPSVVKEAIEADDSFSSRSKTYGVEFDNSVASSVCTRIGDAVGKRFNYAIGNNMAYDYDNDFDNIFPWCDIRRCNISGGEVVAYEGDADFKTDGTNGDVFVEIPKFYSYRNVNGTKEQICISGTPKSGFEVEPAFIDGDGNEIDYIYVAAYVTTNNNESKTDSIPQTSTYFNTFYDNAALKSYDVYDIAVLNAIQKLIIIENANKNVSQYYEGYGEILYYGNAQANETASGVNTFQVAGGTQCLKLRVGQNVAIGNNVYNDIRKITAMTTPVLNSGTYKYEFSVTISGDPVDVVAGTTQFYGTQQDNGGCDAMDYHTGRAGENGITACRYRWIENLWGNVWGQVGGIVIKDLDYYFTYDKSKYKSTLDYFTKLEAFKAPAQNQYPSTIYGWITANGYDRNNKSLILPKSIASNASSYYSAKVYTYGTTTPDGTPVPAGTELSCVGGGGWDHLNRNSPFSLRFWQYRGTNGGGYGFLYGSRLVIREKI